MSTEAYRFRKKPVVIEAMKFDGSLESARSLVSWGKERDPIGGVPISYIWADEGANLVVSIATQEGVMVVSTGDWVIRGVAGEYYPCKAEIFSRTYDQCDPVVEIIDD